MPGKYGTCLVNGPFSNLCALAALIVRVPLQFLVSHLCIFGPQDFISLRTKTGDGATRSRGASEFKIQNLI